VNVSTYRITQVCVDVKLSLATSNSFIISAEELECVAKVATGFSFTCFVTDNPLYSKQTKNHCIASYLTTSVAIANILCNCCVILKSVLIK